MSGEPKGTDFESLSVEAIAESVARVFQVVSLSDLPMYRWLQIVNDVTILTEEVRRGAKRQKDALKRSLKVLIRLLDFIGFYLYVFPENSDPDRRFAKFVSDCLRSPSYQTYFSVDSPKEGLSRWILVKYPVACAKCGESSCVCVMNPWVFEDRREDPEEYSRFREKVANRRRDLRELWDRREVQYFTLPSLFAGFARIFRHNYYLQDTWKTVLHLAEEVGEATTELARLELLFLIPERAFELNTAETWTEIDNQTRGIIGEKVKSVKNQETKARLRNDMIRDAQLEAQRIRETADPRMSVAHLVTEKLKEEIADVFSWLVAVVYQLSDGTVLDGNTLFELLKENRCVDIVKHQVQFTCPQCGESLCSNNCLVENTVAAELYEKVAQM